MNKFKGTQGKWEVVSRDEKYFHIDIDGESLLRFCKPKKYYTDYVRRVDENGCEITTLSDEVAARNGRYVATEEIKKQVIQEEKANAYLVAAAPELLKALIELVESVNETVAIGCPTGYAESVIKKALNL